MAIETEVDPTKEHVPFLSIQSVGTLLQSVAQEVETFASASGYENLSGNANGSQIIRAVPSGLNLNHWDEDDGTEKLARNILHAGTNSAKACCTQHVITLDRLSSTDVQATATSLTEQPLSDVTSDAAMRYQLNLLKQPVLRQVLKRLHVHCYVFFAKRKGRKEGQ